MNPSRYKNYLLLVLLVILAFNFVDRLALGLMLQDIKADLALSDTELGLLSGLAFSVFYSVMGLPMARWADRGNRIAIISITTLLWSVAVALCGMAGSFVQLLLARTAVAVGEAGCVPPAHSLIADYFSRAQRPRAVARYMLGGSLSVVFGYLLAGWLNQRYGWRITFLLLGSPGLALAPIAWFTLSEPRRSLHASGSSRGVTRSDSPDSGSTRGPAHEPSTLEACRTLWHNRTFRHLTLSYALTSLFGYGIGQWQPAFFVRQYGLETGELGTWLTMVYGLGGVVGTYCGGEWASRCAANQEPLQLRVIAVAVVSFGVFTAGVYLSPNAYVAFGSMAVAAVGSAATSGPLFATIQSVVADRMRALSIAILYLLANLIGMGLGPLAAGALSDTLHKVYGEESLRYALLALCPGYLWGAWHLWRASQTVTGDLKSEPTEADRQRMQRQHGCAHELSKECAP